MNPLGLLKASRFNHATVEIWEQQKEECNLSYLGLAAFPAPNSAKQRSVLSDISWKRSHVCVDLPHGSAEVIFLFAHWSV